MSIDDVEHDGRDLSKTHYSLKGRRRINHNPEHVDDPNKRYKDGYDPELAYREIMKKIGNGDNFGSRNPDFFFGWIKD